MDKLQTLSQSLNQYVAMQPDNIEVFVYRQNGGSLSVNGGLFTDLFSRKKVFQERIKCSKAILIIQKLYIN